MAGPGRSGTGAHTTTAPSGRATVAVGAAVAILGGMLSATSVTSPAAAYPTPTVSITGHGYGHGRGLSQYGAYGYATSYSWSYAKILAHFYGGTTLSTQPNTRLTVRLSAWDSQKMVVTSATKFTLGGVAMAAGSSGSVALRSDGKFILAISTGCGRPVVKSVVISSATAVPSAGAEHAKLLTLCGADRRGYRGTLAMVVSGGTHVVNTVLMEDYLRGVVPRESPASWGDAAGGKGMQALMAQAVAARSYAYADNRSSYAKACDTTSCQVYGGAVLNGQVIEDPRADRAVAGTSGKVLRTGGGIVRAEFSSSSGGYTAGGTFPAVPDLGDTASPRHNWTVSVSAGSIGSAFGVGTLSSIEVLSRNGLGADGGRVGLVRVTGSTRSVQVTGSAFRSALGLYSDWFSVPVPPPTGLRQYLADGFDGQRLLPGFEFGRVGDASFTCDFDGNKTDSVGVRRGSAFYLKNDFDTGTSYSVVSFGDAGDIPICGDWDGDGVGTIGVYRPSTARFYLRNSNTAGYHDVMFQLGMPGDSPVVGDFNGDGKDTVGVYRRAEAAFYLLGSNTQTAPRARWVFGSVGRGDVPLVGDWDNNGKDTLGVRRGKTFYLSDLLGALSSIRFDYGDPTDRPLSGDWNGNGSSTVGVTR